MKVNIEHVKGDDIELVVKGDIMNDKMMKLIELLQSIDDLNQSSKIIGIDQGREYVINIDDVERFFTYDGKVMMKTKEKSYFSQKKLFELEKNFKNCGFRRISKGEILNCHYIEYLEVEFSGNYIAGTKIGNKVLISRRYIKSIKKYINEEMI